MKYLNLFFAAIFMLFSLVQFNDPDPLLWITLYAYVTAMFVMEFLGKSNRWALAAGVLVYFPLAAYYFPGNISDWIAAEEQAKSLQMSMPFVEEARESLGLFLAFIAVSVLLFKNAMKKEKQTVQKEKTKVEKV